MLSSIPADAQSPPTTQSVGHRVTGIVIDAARAPLPGTELQLARAGDPRLTIRAGADGRFVFPHLADGEVELVVRRLGYRPRSISLDVGSGSEGRILEITLEVVANELPEVDVIGRDSRLREFYQRRSQHSSGNFITQADIQKLNPRFTSDLFRRVPGASLRSSKFGNAIRLRGCRPKVWMDGVPMRDIELDELTTPAQIAGLEIYPSVAGLPPQYMDMEPRPCGVILVWTRVN